MSCNKWFQGKPSPYDRLISLIAPIGAWLFAGYQTEPVLLNAAAVALGDNFLDIGDPIACRFFKNISVFGRFTKGDASSLVEFRWLLQYDQFGSLTPVEPKYAIDQENRSDRTHYETLPAGASKDLYLSLDLKNNVPYVQLQGRCPGASTCQFQANAQYVLGY